MMINDKIYQLGYDHSIDDLVIEKEMTNLNLIDAYLTMTLKNYSNDQTAIKSTEFYSFEPTHLLIYSSMRRFDQISNDISKSTNYTLIMNYQNIFRRPPDLSINKIYLASLISFNFTETIIALLTDDYTF